MVDRSLELEARAHGMRCSPTSSEALLWGALGGRRLGAQFRRQLIIGQRIADFTAPAVKLVVDVDGSYHARRRSADERREAKLARLGWRVLRLDADLVLRDLEVALARIREALGE